jgi:hypothetical protein
MKSYNNSKLTPTYLCIVDGMGTHSKVDIEPRSIFPFTISFVQESFAWNSNNYNWVKYSLDTPITKYLHINKSPMYDAYRNFYYELGNLLSTYDFTPLEINKIQYEVGCTFSKISYENKNQTLTNNEYITLFMEGYKKNQILNKLK